MKREAVSYIRRIRNEKKKKLYAEAFATHLELRTPEPDRPEGLSYMGAQAVRIDLYAIYRKAES